MLFRHADAEQAFRVHVAEIPDRESRLAVMLGGARRQHALAEASRLADQRGLLVVEPEGVRCQDRRVVFVRVGGVHAASVSGRRTEYSMQKVENLRIKSRRGLEIR